MLCRVRKIVATTLSGLLGAGIVLSSITPAVAFQASSQQQMTPAQQQAYRQQMAQQQAAQQQASQQNGQQPLAPGQRRVPLVQVEQAVAAGQAQVAQPPWPALSAQDQQFVNAVLQVWEKRTADIKRYTCTVQRWQFNPANFAAGHFSRGVGTLKFEDPGKAEYKIDKLETLVKESPPEYAVNPDEPHGEHWICDGRWIHILDQNEKKALRVELPPEYRDNKVFQSPLPFVFGVKADEMLRRYWIRNVAVEGKPNEVLLEVVPKRADDAGNYSRVQIYLDRADTLPKAMVVFMPNWTPKNQVREIYQFDNRSVNPVMDALRANLFRKSFIATTLGKDWTVEEKPYIPPEARQQVANPQTPGQPINR